MLEKEGKAPPIMAKMYSKAILNMPGYFSSFIVGKQQLIELRERTKEEMGANFSLEEFHRWVGEAGPVPYALLVREIDERLKES